MSDHLINDTVGIVPIASLRRRRTAAFAFLAAGIIIWVFAAALLLTRAANEKEQIAQRIQTQTSNLSFKFDQEITAIKFLLTGLSKSPALISGDLRALYEQMRSTSVPDGTWLLFQDMEKQLINTKLPFGSDLPRHTYFPNYKDILEHIRKRRWTVSERKIGPAAGHVIIGLNLRIDDAKGEMSHILTSIVSETRLAAVLETQTVSPGWMKGLYDQNLQPIVTAIGERGGFAIAAPPRLQERLGKPSGDAAVEGTYTDRSPDNQPVLVTYRYSASTNWTTIIEVPLAFIDQPLKSALLQIGWLGLVPLVTAGLGTLLFARRMEKPLDALEGIMASSSQQISDLSAQLLALQEDERQRIARELHDSTAQHLVAVSIGLANLGDRSSRPEKEIKLIEQLENMVDRSLKELRIFTYLLHPPDLARDGLQTTLREFTEGFARRADIEAHIRIPEEVDTLPDEVQWAVLRVAQEALANVHRHAAAAHVALTIRLTANRMVLQVRDDGRGMPKEESRDAKIKLGVGLPGMRARLRQFGGDLRIRTGPGGTTLAATIPLSRMGRASVKAKRLADALLPAPTKGAGH